MKHKNLLFIKTSHLLVLWFIIRKLELQEGIESSYNQNNTFPIIIIH